MTSLLVAGAVLLAALLAYALWAQFRRNAELRAQLETASANLQHLQQACSALAPAGVVQRLIADRLTPLSDAAERKTVTSLFVDLVGYTPMAERLEPAVLVRVLNGYYQRMADAVHEHRGHVGAFIGDGVVAFFGALEPNPWQSDDAVSAALAMRAAVVEYNAELAAEGLPPLAIGVGIDRGSGIVGLFGARDRLEYSFIGRTVNLAARVEALTRTHQVDILVTDAVRAELDPGFKLAEMPAETLKGISDPVVTYAVLERVRAAEPTVVRPQPPVKVCPDSLAG
jgi:class 3 adenylate cyclase